jgi:hypothetical protein
MAIRISQKVAPDFPFPICAMDLYLPPKTTNSKPDSFRRSFRKSSNEKTKEKRSGLGAQQKKIECLERRMGALKALNCERDLEHLQQTTTIALAREKSSTLELLKLRQTKQGVMIDG